MAGKKTDTERIDALEEQVASLLNGKSVAKSKPAAKKPSSGSSAKNTKTNANKTSAAKKPAAEKSANSASAETEAPVKATAEKKPAAKKAAPKKPAAQKQDEKKPSGKSATAKAAPAKTTAAKKPAARKAAEEAPNQTEAVAEQQPEIENITPVGDGAPAASADDVREQPPVETVAAAEEAPPSDPVENEKPTEIADSSARADEQQVDVKAEDTAAAQAEERTEPSPVAQAEVAASENADDKKTEDRKSGKNNGDGSKTDAFIGKSRKIVDKGMLPLFIVANALMAVAAVLLCIFSFDISHGNGADKTTSWYTIVGYLFNSAAIKSWFSFTVGGYGGAGYAVVGIFIVLSILVMWALVIKNVIVLLVKKDKNIYLLDALITFAFMLADIAVFNMFGVNVTAGQIVAFVVSVLLLAVTSFVCTVSKSKRSLPILSLIALVLTVPAMFLLTSYVYGTDQGDYYAANAASVVGGIGAVMFILILLSVLLLIFNAVIQLLRLPKIVKIVAPAVSALAAIGALAVAAIAMPSDIDGIGIGVGFVIGVVLNIILAIVGTVFGAVKPLAKYSGSISDSVLKYETAEGTADAMPKQPVAEAAQTDATADATPEQPAAEPSAPEQAQPVERVERIVCSKCGKENTPDSRFCVLCGNKLKND